MMFLLFGRMITCVGVDRFDRVEQFGGRRVQRLATGDHPLHAELTEQLGRARRHWPTATTAHVTGRQAEAGAGCDAARP